jgi:hypothetical protein
MDKKQFSNENDTKKSININLLIETFKNFLKDNIVPICLVYDDLFMQLNIFPKLNNINYQIVKENSIIQEKIVYLVPENFDLCLLIEKIYKSSCKFSLVINSLKNLFDYDKVVYDINNNYKIEIIESCYSDNLNTNLAILMQMSKKIVEINLNNSEEALYNIFRQMNISNQHFATKKMNPLKNKFPSTNKNEVSQMNYSKKTHKELITICKDMNIKGYSRKKKKKLIDMITQVSALKIDVKLPTKVKIIGLTLKSQRKTKNLGKNTVNTRDESYTKIEAKSPTHRCTDVNHQGERTLAVRKFYLRNGGKGLQGACINCQTNYRAKRSKKNREKYQGKTKEEIYEIYIKTYGHTKSCSKCNISKDPSEFSISIGMECGLHNQCIICSVGNSQGNGGLRDFIYMPDKDGIKYKKKEKCERCGGTNKLATDHILPIAKGGTDCISNKQTLCIHCNSKKNDTIDCPVKSDFLSARYKDSSLDFTNNTTLAQILSKKVYKFRQSNIDNASLYEIRNSVKEYSKKHNLGCNLDRIVEKIATIFNKI